MADESDANKYDPESMDDMINILYELAMKLKGQDETNLGINLFGG